MRHVFHGDLAVSVFGNCVWAEDEKDGGRECGGWLY